MRYNHYIVENRVTGERKEVVKCGNLADTPTYKVVGCCGYHETNERKKESKKQ